MRRLTRHASAETPSRRRWRWACDTAHVKIPNSKARQAEPTGLCGYSVLTPFKPSAGVSLVLRLHHVGSPWCPAPHKDSAAAHLGRGLRRTLPLPAGPGRAAFTPQGGLISRSSRLSTAGRPAHNHARATAQAPRLRLRDGWDAARGVRVRTSTTRLAARQGALFGASNITALLFLSPGGRARCCTRFPPGPRGTGGVVAQRILARPPRDGWGGAGGGRAGGGQQRGGGQRNPEADTVLKVARHLGGFRRVLDHLWAAWWRRE